jgi:hypothetical protein
MAKELAKGLEQSAQPQYWGSGAQNSYALLRMAVQSDPLPTIVALQRV